MLFSKKDLRKLVVPLLIEQLLAILVGMIDTIMISSVGEAAVSGVSLVDTLNILLIGLFSALATGGAVVAGQFLGQKKEKEACKAAEQLVLVVLSFSLGLMLIMIVFRTWILKGVFGNIETDVERNARVYFMITTLSIPALAVYNACAALFRAMGNAKVTMWISLGMNGMNFIGNGILIYGCSLGTAGAACATSLSRLGAAIVIMILIFQEERIIHLDKKIRLSFQKDLVKKILLIGIPNGLENSMFQLGKIIVLSLISSFGTYAIASNAVAGTITTFNVLPGTAIGLAMVSVISVCVGADDFEQAKYYTKKLLFLIYVFIWCLSILIFILAPWIVTLYHLTKDTAEITVKLMRYHALCAAAIWPLSFSLPNTFRAANDVKFTMGISVFSMWIFRIAASYALGQRFGLGVFGVWIAMTIDWLFRTICFSVHYIKGKWQLHYKKVS